jgi:hypothetical protein
VAARRAGQQNVATRLRSSLGLFLVLISFAIIWLLRRGLNFVVRHIEYGHPILALMLRVGVVLSTLCIPFCGLFATLLTLAAAADAEATVENGPNFGLIRVQLLSCSGQRT